MKRLFDLIASFIGLCLVLPLLLLIILWVVIDSPGGPFYRQMRVGRHGRKFRLIKFRSMYSGSDKKGLLTVGEKDNRISGAGKFLRKYKLDELPQLLNILAGDMSIVGPRPEVPQYVDLYTDEQKKVLSVRPGLTDPASLKYINENRLLAKYDDPEKAYLEIVMPEKLSLNQEYIEKRNFFFDIRIIFATLGKVILKH